MKVSTSLLVAAVALLCAQAHAAPGRCLDVRLSAPSPIVRGDVEGVQRQLNALPAEQRPIYAQLGLALVEVVKHRHSTATIDAMRDVLRER